MLDTQGNLFPFRQYSQHEVINLFALDGTGMNGILVAMETGNNSPLDSDGSWLSIGPGASFTNTTSYRYQQNRRVRPTVSGDSKYNILGLTTYNVAEYDQHGNKLVLQPQSRWDELGIVPSGYSCPIVMRGIVDISIAQVVGTPFPGYAAVPYSGGNGKIEAIDPTAKLNPTGFFGVQGAGNFYTHNQVIGRFISTTGAQFNGHVQLHLEA